MEPEPEQSETAEAGDWACLVRTSRRRVEERSAGLHEESPISRIFGGVLRSVVRSKGAKADSVSLEPFNLLALDISDSSVTSVRSALQACCRSEAINEGQTRRIEFKVLPHVLVLSLKRFTYTNGKAQKIKKAIQYGDKLTFDRSWLTQPQDVPSEYLITAVICHHGEHANSGHYTAVVRYNAEWYMYDDTTVRRMELSEVAAQQNTAYVIIYQRQGCVDFKP